MNFYPIYKNKKLLPWLKWWIIKGNKITPKQLSEWINSASPITLTGVYKGSPLLYLSLKGNTSQTGTPSPEAPVPVNVVKGNNTITINDTNYPLDLTGINRAEFDTTKDTTRYTYINFSESDITVEKTVTGGSFYASFTLHIPTAGTYAITGNALGTQQIYIYNDRLWGTLKENFSVQAGNFNRPTTFTSAGDYVIGLYGSTTGNYSVKNFMCFEGSTATTYEPYYDYELCKIGDYQDVIYKEDNKWYVDKNIEKVTFNGTETWKRTQVSASSSYAFWNQYTNLNIPVGKYGQKYCDNFEYQEKKWEESTPNHLAENNTYTSDLSILFNVDNTIATTLTEWNTWLSSHNTTVYYALATSTTTEITNTTLISQLEAIKNATLISGTNSITQTPADLPFYLSFRYYEKG